MDGRPGLIARAEDRVREGWDDARGTVNWSTLFCADLTPTTGMTAGLAELPPGGGARSLHRHAQPEIYYILEGRGILSIEGVESVVEAGAAVFIPGDAAHGLRNASDAVLKLFYVFPANRFADVVYRFAEEP